MVAVYFWVLTNVKTPKVIDIKELIKFFMKYSIICTKIFNKVHSDAENVKDGYFNLFCVKGSNI